MAGAGYGLRRPRWGHPKGFEVRVPIDSEVEVDYHRHGRLLQMVLRRMPTGGVSVPAGQRSRRAKVHPARTATTTR